MIIPSIIATTFEEVKRKIVLLDDVSDWAQLDIADGLFAGPITWSAPDDLVNLDGKIKLEAHLMVKEPEEMLKMWADYTDRILVHAEATKHLAEIAEATKETPAKLGVALKIDTPLDILAEMEAVDKIHCLQLMSIDELGHYGAKFDERIYERIKQAREMYPNLEINIDGGVTLDNAPKLLEAGVTNLVVGSAIWNAEDPIIELKKFQSL